MAGRTRSKTYDVLAVSSTVHKANADYLAGILRYASGRPDWRLWLFNPLADYSFGNVLPTRRASGVIVNGLDDVVYKFHMYQPLAYTHQYVIGVTAQGVKEKGLAIWP